MSDWSTKPEVQFRWRGDLPAAAGNLRVEPEDFVVEECLAYEPSGQGAHFYFWIEKRGLSTQELLRRAAQQLACPVADLGYAGQKDGWALTRQWISCPATLDSTRLQGGEAWRVLDRTRHNNKIKLSHGRGNRFEIRVRGLAPGGRARIEEIKEALGDWSPNGFGAQRFGRGRRNHRIGLALLRADWGLALKELLGAPQRALDGERAAREHYENGDLERALQSWRSSDRSEQAALNSLKHRPGDARAAIRAIPGPLLFFYKCAAQSALFNRYLDRRAALGASVLDGEVLSLVKNGACFLCSDPLTDGARAQAGELAISGPIYGRGLLKARAGSVPAALEDELVDGLAPAFEDARNRLCGERRPLRVPLRDWSIVDEAEGLRLRFQLPKGSFATSLLAELFDDDSLCASWDET